MIPESIYGGLIRVSGFLKRACVILGVVLDSAL